ncbi:Nn.00g043060.m01.CDS01 [Neocucurbitaria sp. VM-36]
MSSPLPQPEPQPQPQRILLLGLGELGTALLRPLSALPHTHITVAVRSPEKYTSLLSSLNPQITTTTTNDKNSNSNSRNISLLPLDLTAPSPVLTPIFSTYNILISATGFAQSPSTVLKLAHEVLQAGKLRKERGDVGELWFFPWQWGVNYDITGSNNGLMPLFGAQKDVRDLLRSKAGESNVKWTVVSTGMFMSFLFEPFWGIVERGDEKEHGNTEGNGEGKEKVVVRCLKDWSHGVTVTHVNDIGLILARIIGGDIPIDATNKILYTAGSTISYGALADLIERVTGSEVVRETWGVEQLAEEVRQDPEDGIKKYRLVFAGEGVSWAKQGTVNEESGMEMVSVERYVEGLFGVGGWVEE